jgi:CMP-N,N'-diacetyllegionaminic acid synthase
MKILGVIPARAGSKGVPHKNRRKLGGMSLVERTFRVAEESGVLDRIVLSTDDLELMREAKMIGLDVPFIRPANLADDEAPMLDVVLHALHSVNREGYHPTAVMILQPTSPLRHSNHLVKAVSMLKGADSVCSVIEIPAAMSPHYVMRIENGSLKNYLPNGEKVTRRQDAPVAYQREGTVYLVRTSVLSEQRSIYGKKCRPLILNPNESVSIDTWDEWDLAQSRLKGAA